MLVGINLTSYGKGEDIDLADAVDAVCSVEGIRRVRLGSLEPDHISDQMLLRFKTQEKFCPQFHLSLQSGCDRTLKRMNRHYDTAFYTDLVNRIRNTFDNPSITTDIMVGFAGETEQEFNQSVEFLKHIGFAKSHVFAYSRRKGTVAYGLPDQISKKDKLARSKVMLAAANECEQKFLSSNIDKVYSVLFETSEDGFYYGYTPNYLRVAVKSDANIKGEILQVKIISAESEYCIGSLTN